MPCDMPLLFLSGVDTNSYVLLCWLDRTDFFQNEMILRCPPRRATNNDLHFMGNEQSALLSPSKGCSVHCFKPHLICSFCKTSLTPRLSVLLNTLIPRRNQFKYWSPLPSEPEKRVSVDPETATASCSASLARLAVTGGLHVGWKSTATGSSAVTWQVCTGRGVSRSWYMKKLKRYG